jgi:four helix bundle protein
MDSSILLNRLKQFAYRIVKVTDQIPDNLVTKVLKNQILRSGFSGAANYRSACRAYSRRSFAAKLGISLEEVDESVFWLEVIGDLDFIPLKRLQPLIDEGNELCKILAKSILTTKTKK